MHPIKRQFLFLIVFVFICLAQATAQKRTFYQEGKLVDSVKSPVLKYFSGLYDTVFAYDEYDNWMTLKRHYKVFAIKQNKYYKLDCLIGFFANDIFYLDSVQITKSVACTNTAGKAFLKALKNQHIYNLPIDDFKRSCRIYDSSGAIKSGLSVADGIVDRFLFFDSKSVSTTSYEASEELYNACHDPKLVPTIELIDLFHKGWLNEQSHLLVSNL